MSWFVRPAREEDLDAVLELAKLTGAGFTNLPPNRESLQKRLAWSAQSFARTEDLPENELYMLLMEEAGTGRIGGSALLFSRLGIEWPFYSYKIAQLHQYSKELGRSIKTEVLHLVNDFNGASEVGGLFLHPELRAGGLGRLLARSRYIFMARHRKRFGEQVIAELRGDIDGEGSSPFWDGLGRLFFGMPFQEADRFNSLHGNQFIADLMPKYPIYTALLSESARAAIGKPHETGIPAMRMLEKEGFAYGGYIDIFDGGPTVAAPVDRLKTVQHALLLPVGGIDDRTPEDRRALMAKGELLEFRAWHSGAGASEDGLNIPADEAALMKIKTGDILSYVAP